MAGTQHLHEMRRSGIRAVQSTPLQSRAGRRLGTLSTHWRTPHTPTEDDFRLFDVLARQVADLIERMHAEDAARNAQEEERRRIARDLHDDISQRLAILSISLDTLAQSSSTSSAESRQKINDVREAVANLAKDVRAISHRLHPARLDYLEIADAAAALCHEMSIQHGVAISFYAQSAPKGLSRRIVVCLYRVLQEALQNAIKHSGVRKIEVLLCRRSDQIELTISDHGIGFDPKTTQGRGLGLVSMKERLKTVLGRLAISSEPKRGTMIQAWVPLPQDESENPERS
jgi:signal transduction histidine kinase